MPRRVLFTKAARKQLTRQTIAIMIEHWLLDGGTVTVREGCHIGADKDEAMLIINRLWGKNPILDPSETETDSFPPDPYSNP